jgi:hypothetical protein
MESNGERREENGADAHEEFLIGFLLRLESRSKLYMSFVLGNVGIM